MVKPYIAERLIISVGEARRILSSEAYQISDEELADLILKLNELAPYLLSIASRNEDIL